MADFDPFDSDITNEDSPRGPGRPRTRQIRENNQQMFGTYWLFMYLCSKPI